LEARASCPFGAGAQPVSPEFIRAVVLEPERLRALRLRQRLGAASSTVLRLYRAGDRPACRV